MVRGDDLIDDSSVVSPAVSVGGLLSPISKVGDAHPDPTCLVSGHVFTSSHGSSYSSSPLVVSQPVGAARGCDAALSSPDNPLLLLCV